MDDYTAIGAVSEFRKLGIDIPKRVAVIGQDNSVFSIASEPQLTTIDTKIESMSAITAKALHDIFFKNPVGNSITIYPELIVRETT